MCWVCVVKPACMFHLCIVCIGAVIYVQVCTYVNIRLCVSAMYEYADMSAHVCKCGAFVRADLVSVGMCERVHSCGCADTVHVCFTCSMCVQKHSIPTYTAYADTHMSVCGVYLVISSFLHVRCWGVHTCCLCVPTQCMWQVSDCTNVAQVCICECVVIHA